MIEVLGIIAGAFVIATMLPFMRDLLLIKAFLLIGAILFLTYGAILGLPAIIFMNIFGVILGTESVIKLIRKRIHGN